MTDINLNDEVWVKLTETGICRYYEYWWMLPNLAERLEAHTEADGWQKFQLRELMLIFGPLLNVGSQRQPFVDNIIRLTYVPCGE